MAGKILARPEGLEAKPLLTAIIVVKPVINNRLVTQQNQSYFKVLFISGVLALMAINTGAP